jgi:hypothetical protein
MELEYSNDKKSQDRIKKLKKLKLTYKLIELFIFLTAFNFSLAREFDLITIIVFALVIAGSAGMLEFICNTFVVNNIKEISNFVIRKNCLEIFFKFSISKNIVIYIIYLV